MNWATGDGYVIAKNNSINSTSALMDVMDRYLEQNQYDELIETSYGMSLLNDGAVFINYNGAWDEDAILGLLNHIADKITYGKIMFGDSDNDFWCYVFENNEWVDKTGHIIYGDMNDAAKQTIEELGFEIEQ